MPTPTHLLLSLVLLSAAVLAAPGPAWAQAAQWQDYRQVAVVGVRAKQSKASSAAEAAKIAKKRYGGKILKVEAVKTEEGMRYRVKILQDNGRVKTVVI